MINQRTFFRKTGKMIFFLIICVLLGFLPVFVHFDCKDNWIHLRGEFRQVYGIESFYKCVEPPADSFHPPHYQPIMANSFLLAVYSFVIYESGLVGLRRVRKWLKKSSQNKTAKNNPVS
ncbi:MAG: hypothetical protein PHV34_16625 [Verrucomicrobiae bacterium]|nr:hypothetical protein [Verrucomicrobiae bacterium]